MTLAWLLATLAAATLAAVELIALNRRRRSLVGPLRLSLLLPAGARPPATGAAAGGSVAAAAPEASPAMVASEATDREGVARAPVSTLRSRASQRRRLRQHAARNVLYWVSIAADEESSAPTPSPNRLLSVPSENLRRATNEQFVNGSPPFPPFQGKLRQQPGAGPQFGKAGVHGSNRPAPRRWASSQGERKRLEDTVSGTAHPEPSDSAQEDLLVEARREVLPRPADATTSPALLDSESAVKSVAAAGSDAAAATSQPVDDGIVYVDAAGRVTFANQAARTLLQWNGGELALGDVLAGGRVEAAALLEAVSRQELVERSVTLQIGSWRGSLEVSTLALRDRDGNLWGAALFLRRSGDQAAASSATPR